MKRKWSNEQRQNFATTMRRRKLATSRDAAKKLAAGVAKGRALKRVEVLKEEREERSEGLDVSVWRTEQRPTHIYIQEAGRLRRYDLRSLEVYVPEDIVL
jgi:hypothetical protein